MIIFYPLDFVFEECVDKWSNQYVFAASCLKVPLILLFA